MTRIILAACAGLAVLWAAVASAAFPDRPVRIVVPFAPGGANDHAARLYADKLGAALGQSFIVDNRPGASGDIAAEHVANAPADGYTLLLGANAVLVVNPVLRPDVRYHGSDFVAAGIIAQAPCLLVVPANLPVNNVAELVQYAQSRGDAMNFASPGQGTQMHLLGELFKAQTGAGITHVAYRGSVPALTDLIGGRVQMMFDNVQSALPQVQAGKLKALAVTGNQRLAALPQVPTMAEAGFANIDAVSWFSIMAPAATPQPVLRQLQQAIATAQADPDTRRRLGAFGASLPAVPPQGAEAFIAAERARWTKVIQEAGIRVE
ncbi:Bug family tripartite tricarboxylate transporter substrate binding protein [Roseomonas chloroacetimidivorans]|uniref:Bug family tripartite tricarboxylate transporter substrate binding protein n=1 Tax=Roseomonas chloroacetimidivorans TaxID=1766656 RepID=UPI003C74D8D8